MSNSPLITYTLMSPNRSSPRNHEIDRVSIHCFVGQVTAKRGCEVFYPASRKASCQYVVGYDGSRGQNVDEAGCKVRVLKAVTYTGKPFKTWYDVYDVLEVNGARAVIGIGKTVTAAVNINNIERV